MSTIRDLYLKEAKEVVYDWYASQDMHFISEHLLNYLKRDIAEKLFKSNKEAFLKGYKTGYKHGFNNDPFKPEL